MNKSFRAVVSAEPGRLLIGGVQHHRSSRFATREMAERWAEVIVESNKSAGRPCKVLIVSSKRAPEVA